MAKKNPDKTPRSKIKNGLRMMWMRSRERAAALKREKYTCQGCNTKQTLVKGKEFKVQVHHRYGIDWEDLVDLVFERLLQSPKDYDVLCKECHSKKHK